LLRFCINLKTGKRKITTKKVRYAGKWRVHSLKRIISPTCVDCHLLVARKRWGVNETALCFEARAQKHISDQWQLFRSAAAPCGCRSLAKKLENRPQKKNLWSVTVRLWGKSKLFQPYRFRRVFVVRRVPSDAHCVGFCILNQHCHTHAWALKRIRYGGNETINSCHEPSSGSI